MQDNGLINHGDSLLKAIHLCQKLILTLQKKKNQQKRNDYLNIHYEAIR